MEAWRMKDPARVYERIEAQEQARAARSPAAKQERAVVKLKEFFKEAPKDGIDNR